MFIRHRSLFWAIPFSVGCFVWRCKCSSRFIGVFTYMKHQLIVKASTRSLFFFYPWRYHSEQLLAWQHDKRSFTVYRWCYYFMISLVMVTRYMIPLLSHGWYCCSGALHGIHSCFHILMMMLAALPIAMVARHKIKLSLLPSLRIATQITQQQPNLIVASTWVPNEKTIHQYIKLFNVLGILFGDKLIKRKGVDKFLDKGVDIGL